VLATQSRAASSHVDFRLVCAAAEDVYAKPTLIHARLADFLVHLHAESLVGLTKSISIRTIRAKQAEATVVSVAATAKSNQGVTLPLRRASKLEAGAAPSSIPSSASSSTPPPRHSHASSPSALQSTSSPSASSLSAQLESVRKWAHDAREQVRLRCFEVMKATCDSHDQLAHMLYAGHGA
jgi:hypothetical protein